MLLFRSSWLQTCVLHSISFLSPFVQASLHGDVSEDWSLFTSSPLAEDYGLDGMAVEESNALPFQSTGDVYIDFSGNELFPPSANNDGYTDCGGYPPPSTKYKKRDNNPGFCQSSTATDPKPNTNDINNGNSLSPLAPTLEPNILHTMFNDELAQSKTMNGNPCAEIYHVLCCLGPRQYFVNILHCDFFAGALNCLGHEGASIYCCLEVGYDGIGTWSLVGRYCEI